MAVRLGLIGYPVSHSLSPSFQQPALDALGIEATYELWPTPLEEVPARVASLRAPGVLGANVTVPHKQVVAELLDEISEAGQRAGAINTVIHRDGRLTGENTDIPGLVRSLRESGFERGGFSALLVGAGGASRGAVLALEALGVGHLTIVNRTVERAAELLTLVPKIDADIAALDDEEALSLSLGRSDLVINATSLGWKDGETPFDPALMNALPSTAVAMDLTYRETPFLTAAKQCGVTAVDGLAMLVYQGARSLELWTGRDAPVDLMMAAALEARSAAS